jgi:hypothetical protein
VQHAAHRRAAAGDVLKSVAEPWRRLLRNDILALLPGRLSLHLEHFGWKLCHQACPSVTDLTPSSEPTEIVSLSQEQDYLLRALRVRDGRFASRTESIFLGAVIVLAQRGNPERFSQSAQSVRELLERLSRQNDGETIQLQRTKASEYLHSMASALDSAKGESRCFVTEGNDWRGEVDDPLRNLLVHVDSVVTRHRETARNSEIEKRFLRELDPPADHEPSQQYTATLDQRARQWRAFSKRFQDVAHHNVYPTAAQYGTLLNECTAFLLERLHRTSDARLEELDKLIAEAERDA